MTSSGLGKVYADGEVLIHQGDLGNEMFVIQEGEVEILVETDGGSSRINVLGQGEIIGEMAVFEQEVRSATVRALGEVRALSVDRRNFLRRMAEEPSIAFTLVQMMSRRIRELSQQLADLKGASDQAH